MGDLYAEICSIENLELALKKARKGKTLKAYVVEFEKQKKENLQKLKIELLMQTYKPQPLKIFILRDPKTRKISKSAFRDRIIHHAICNIIEPIFEKQFIYDSYANRIGKGTLNALKRFDVFKRKVSKNNTLKCFVLKADIKKYFDTVNRDILLDVLKKRIQDSNVIALIKNILGNYEGDKPNKGMPLGNLTSQFFANVYLNELDQFVKHKLKAKYYLRYVDDFAIIHQSKQTLEEYKIEIDKFLKEKLDIQLHPAKSQVVLLDKGISFLGFRVFYHHKLLRKKNLRKFENNLEELKQLYADGTIPREKVIEKFEGWIAYAKHGNTYKYRKKVTGEFSKYFPIKESTPVPQLKKVERFNNSVEISNAQFTTQKTFQLFREKKTPKEIAELRGIKESTVWDHFANLIEHSQLRVSEVITANRIKIIHPAIKRKKDKLKEIKSRISDPTIKYEEINCVLASLKCKAKGKSAYYLVNWYQKTNCCRKCFLDKPQRLKCREKFKLFVSHNPTLNLTTKKFLNLFNNHMKICVLPEQLKRKFVSWKEFMELVKKKKK